MRPPNPGGGISLVMGATARQCPFCISILTSVRRIVKITVRFLHTKTALCDRKDTQSRFAVNAARSIMCVGIVRVLPISRAISLFQCRTQHCVCRDDHPEHLAESGFSRFNAARGIMCVGTRQNAALRPCRSTSHFLLIYDSTRFVLFQ